MNVLLILAALSQVVVEADLRIVAGSPAGDDPARCQAAGSPGESIGFLASVTPDPDPDPGDPASWSGNVSLTYRGNLTSFGVTHYPDFGEFTVFGTVDPVIAYVQLLMPDHGQIAVYHDSGGPAPLYCLFDLSVDSLVELMPGDSNRDGLFDSGDLIEVFRAGKYESIESADWSAGDWNADGVFSTRDLTFALQTGAYEQPGPSSVPEPSGFALAAVAAVFAVRMRPSRPGRAFARRR